MTFPKASAFDPAGPSSHSPEGRVLGNGAYVTLVTAEGGGFSAHGGVWLTRGPGDRVEDAGGLRLSIAPVAPPGPAVAWDPGPPSELSGFQWQAGCLEIE